MHRIPFPVNIIFFFLSDTIYAHAPDVLLLITLPVSIILCSKFLISLRISIILCPKFLISLSVINILCPSS